MLGPDAGWAADEAAPIGGGSETIKPFISRLWEILEKPEFNHIVRWCGA